MRDSDTAEDRGESEDIGRVGQEIMRAHVCLTTGTAGGFTAASGTVRVCLKGCVVLIREK